MNYKDNWVSGSGSLKRFKLKNNIKILFFILIKVLFMYITHFMHFLLKS